MAQAKQGDRVTIDYTGKLADGTIFDSTNESVHGADECDTGECEPDECGCGCEAGPMTLTIGEGTFLPQVEEVLVGMSPGETKTIVIPAPEAFGEFDQTKIFTVPRTDLPADLTPAVGDELVLTSEEDESIGVVVTEVTDHSVTFDANHPLAGEDLTFDVHLLEIL